MSLVYHVLSLAHFREFLASGWRLAPVDAEHPFLWFSPRPPQGLELDEVALVLDPSSFANQLIKRGSRGWRTSTPHTSLRLTPEGVERLLVADEHLVPGIQALVPNVRIIPLDQEAKVALLDYAENPSVMFDLETAEDPTAQPCKGGRPNCIDGLHSHPQGEDGPARAHAATVKGKPGIIGAPNFFRREPHAANSKSIAKTDGGGYHGQHTPPGAKVKLTPERVRYVTTGELAAMGEAAFDTSAKNTDLLRTAAALASAAKQHPVNPTTIRRYVERMVYALEVSVLAVLDRADAMRFSSLIRSALASLEDGLTGVDVTAESAGNSDGLKKPLAQLRALVVDSAAELARDGQSPQRGGGLRSSARSRSRSVHRPRPIARDDDPGE